MSCVTEIDIPNCINIRTSSTSMYISICTWHLLLKNLNIYIFLTLNLRDYNRGGRSVQNFQFFFIQTLTLSRRKGKNQEGGRLRNTSGDDIIFVPYLGPQPGPYKEFIKIQIINPLSIRDIFLFGISNFIYLLSICLGLSAFHKIVGVGLCVKLNRIGYGNVFWRVIKMR